MHKFIYFVDVFDQKTRSHVDLSDTNQTEVGAKDSYHNPKVYLVIQKRTKNWFIDLSLDIGIFIIIGRTGMIVGASKACSVLRVTRQWIRDAQVTF